MPSVLDLPAEVSDRMEVLQTKASTALERGLFDSSIELYTEAIKLNPASELLYTNRSLAYLNKGQFVYALRDAKKCIEINPHFARGYFRKGQAFEKLLHYTSACEAYDAGLKNCPEDPELTSARKVLADLDEILNYSHPAAAPENDRFARLVQWLKEGGAKFPRLHLKYYSDDYRGVHALGDIQVDDVALYVPLRMIMTSEVARASPIGIQITQANIELRSKHSYLAAFLLAERAKGEDSVWAPYINTLPTKFANVPIFFTEPELAWLKGSFTVNKIADRIESLAAEYATLCKALPNFKVHSYSDFVWARLAVITRIFGLQVGGVKTDGLVPYADFLNHKLPRETRWCYDDPTGGFLITALQPIARGQPVFDSYGRKCNNRFFVNYGFVIMDNPDNEACVRVCVDPEDPLYAIKLRMLGSRASTVTREYQVPADYREAKCREMFSFLRLAAMDQQALDTHVSSSHGRAHHGHGEIDVEPVSVANEIGALTLLKTAAEQALALFPDSIEEDEAEVAAGTLAQYSNEHNCLVMRLGEKRVLEWMRRLSDLAITLLQKGDAAEARNVIGNEQTRAKTTDFQYNFESYLLRVVNPLLRERR